MVAVLQYTTIIKIGAQKAQRSLFAQPNEHQHIKEIVLNLQL